MNQLETTAQEILRLRSLIEQNRAQFRRNETQTRTGLIDPMLRTLGWDVGNPAEVVTETGAQFEDDVPRRADYVLKERRSGEPTIIVEAKALDDNLENAIGQVSSYCLEAWVERGVVTDGNEWILLEVREEHEDEDDELEESEAVVMEIARFSICDGDAVINAVLAQQLTNKASISFDELEGNWTAMSRAFVSTGKVPSAEVSQTASSQTRTLASLKDMQAPPVPAVLLLPGHYAIRVPAPEWRDWVVQVAIYMYVWLADYLDEYDEDDFPSPVYRPRSRQFYVVNDEPEHENGEDFEDEFQVAEDVYLELDFGRRSGSEIVCAMLEEGGFDPEEATALFG